MKLLSNIIKKLGGKTEGMEGSFLSNGIMTFINQFGNLFIGLIIMITMRNWIGEEDAGTFVAGFSYAFLLMQFALFGFDNLSIRELANWVSKDEHSIAKSFHKYSNILVWVISVVLTAVLSIWFYMQDTPETNFYIISVLSVPFFSILLLNQFKLLGLGHVVASQTPEKLIRPLILLLSMALIHYFFPESEGLMPLLLINLLAFVIVWSISDLIFNHRLNIWGKLTEQKKVQTSENHKPQRKIWLSAAFGLFVYSIIGHFNSKIDIVMIDWMIPNNEDISYYNTAHRFGSFVAFGALIVNQMMGPIVSNHFTRNEINPLKKIVAKTSLFSVLAAIPTILFFYFFGDWMINFLFERSVPQEQEVLMITSIGYLFQVFAGSAAFLLIMKKGTSIYATLSIAFGLIFNIICNIILIPKFGIIGAAYGTTSALLVWTILMVIFVRWKVGINPTFFSKYLFK